MYSEWYVIHQVNVTITPLGGTIMYNDRGLYVIHQVKGILQTYSFLGLYILYFNVYTYSESSVYAPSLQ